MSEASRIPIKPLGIGEVALRVNDLRRSIAFYCETLGFTLVRVLHDSIAFVRVADGFEGHTQVIGLFGRDRQASGDGQRWDGCPPSEPYGRFSRIRLSSRWFPHRDCLAFRQAASRVNSSGGAKNLFGRQTIPNTSFDTVTGADSMRSVQTEPFTRDKSRASAPCLAICINGAVMASSRFPTSIFLPCLPSRGVC